MYKCATNIWLLHNCLFKYIQRKEMERTSKISMTKANVVSHSILDRKKKHKYLFEVMVYTIQNIPQKN